MAVQYDRQQTKKYNEGGAPQKQPLQSYLVRQHMISMIQNPLVQFFALSHTTPDVHKVQRNPTIPSKAVPSLLAFRFILVRWRDNRPTNKIERPQHLILVSVHCMTESTIGLPKTGINTREILRRILRSKSQRTNNATSATRSNKGCTCKCTLPLSTDIVCLICHNAR